MENHPLNEASDLSPAVRPLVQFAHAAVSVSVRPEAQDLIVPGVLGAYLALEGIACGPL